MKETTDESGGDLVIDRAQHQNPFIGALGILEPVVPGEPFFTPSRSSVSEHLSFLFVGAHLFLQQIFLGERGVVPPVPKTLNAESSF